MRERIIHETVEYGAVVFFQEECVSQLIKEIDK